MFVFDSVTEDKETNLENIGDAGLSSAGGTCPNSATCPTCTTDACTKAWLEKCVKIDAPTCTAYPSKACDEDEETCIKENY